LNVDGVGGGGGGGGREREQHIEGAAIEIEVRFGDDTLLHNSRYIHVL